MRSKVTLTLVLSTVCLASGTAWAAEGFGGRPYGRPDGRTWHDGMTSTGRVYLQRAPTRQAMAEMNARGRASGTLRPDEHYTYFFSETGRLHFSSVRVAAADPAQTAPNAGAVGARDHGPSGVTLARERLIKDMTRDLAARSTDLAPITIASLAQRISGAPDASAKSIVAQIGAGTPDEVVESALGELTRGGLLRYAGPVRLHRDGVARLERLAKGQLRRAGRLTHQALAELTGQQDPQILDGFVRHLKSRGIVRDEPQNAGVLAAGRAFVREEATERRNWAIALGFDGWAVEADSRLRANWAEYYRLRGQGQPAQPLARSRDDWRRGMWWMITDAVQSHPTLPEAAKALKVGTADLVARMEELGMFELLGAAGSTDCDG